MENQNEAWTGRGKLENLVAELKRQQESKRDFVADTRSLKIVSNEGKLFLKATTRESSEWIPEKSGLQLRDLALEQIAGKSTPIVPNRFLKEMALTRPERLADLLNGLVQDAPAKRFVRALDGKVRAFLSDKYRVLDNYDIAFAALDAVRAAGGTVIEAALSETNMRIKFTTLGVWDVIQQERKAGRSIPSGALGNPEYLKRIGFSIPGELPGGAGTVFPLVTVSNSEVGHGGYSVDIGIIEGACANGMIFESVVGKVHLGERLSLGIFSEATLSQESKAIYMKARDACTAAMNKDVFAKIVSVAKGAQNDIIAKPKSAIENIAKAAGLSDKSKDLLLGYFIKDYDATRFGLAQAVSRLSQDEEGSNEAASLEELAGKIVREGVPAA